MGETSNFLPALTDSSLPLKTRAGQWEREGQALPTGDSKFPCLQKSKEVPTGALTSFQAKTVPFRNGVYRVAQNPHHQVPKTQRTQNNFSGLPPNGPSNNPQTARISRYQGFDPVASPLLQK